MRVLPQKKKSLAYQAQILLGQDMALGFQMLYCAEENQALGLQVFYLIKKYALSGSSVFIASGPNEPLELLKLLLHLKRKSWRPGVFFQTAQK